MIHLLSAGTALQEMAGPGTYVLLMDLAAPLVIGFGKRGQVALPQGRYAYVGSAQGPGGIAARLNRHLRAQKKQRWHIDILTGPSVACSITDVLYVLSRERQECSWVRKLLAGAEAEAPVPGFGSSDCREGCPAHLLHLPGDRTARQIARLLER